MFDLRFDLQIKGTRVHEMGSHTLIHKKFCSSENNHIENSKYGSPFILFSFGNFVIIFHIFKILLLESKHTNLIVSFI